MEAQAGYEKSLNLHTCNDVFGVITQRMHYSAFTTTVTASALWHSPGTEGVVGIPVDNLVLHGCRHGFLAQAETLLLSAKESSAVSGVKPAALITITAICSRLYYRWVRASASYR